MRVMVIMKASEASERGEMPSQQLLTEMMAYNEELVNAGVMLAGEGLHPSSAGARVVFDGSKAPAVVDGPFAETKELIAGFWLWQVKDFQEALDWARKIPNTDGEHHAVELRQVFTAEDFGDAMTPEMAAQEDDLRARSGGYGEERN